MALPTQAPDETAEDAKARVSRLRLALFLLFMGTLHFVVPRAFTRLIPRRIGSPHAWVYASGVWELVSGSLLLTQRTKKAGGWAAAATFVAVFPGNIKMALDAGPPGSSPGAAGAWARLPFQAPLVVWALRQTRD
jgi:uncharacterized membrane protein